jgi:ribose/xylose/arabinose/galactoside ABC-type transport system permease subunit
VNLFLSEPLAWCPCYAWGKIERLDFDLTVRKNIILAIKVRNGIFKTIPLILSVVPGLWNDFLVASVGIQSIIATLILMVAVRGIAQFISQGQNGVFIHEPFQTIES